MLSKIEKTFTILFIGIVLLEIIFGSLPTFSTCHLFTKPLIMISLILFFINQSNLMEKRLRNLMFLALGFSLIGDVLLMFVNRSELFFSFGLIAFLIAHVSYILIFLKHRDPSKSGLGSSLFLFVYGSLIFLFLSQGVGGMLIPVVLYMIVIMSMVLTAYLRNAKTQKLSYQWVLFGAICFIISDSILALHKFYKPIPFNHLGIMLSYALAQYGIVIGILKLKCNNTS